MGPILLIQPSPAIGTEDIKNFPVFEIDKASLKHYERLEKQVELVLHYTAEEKFFEREQIEIDIDLLVYKLYNLLYDEVKIIDPKIGEIISEEEYEKFEIV